MTSSPPLFTAHDVPDLINAVPTLFGFRVEESLVAVATTGPRRRFGFRLRMDVPPAEKAAAVARKVVAHLTNHGAEGAIVIALTEHQEAALLVLDAIHDRLEQTPGIELIVRARADGERYWTDEPGFPPVGLPYETSDHHLSVVQAIAAGQQILPSRQALVDRFKPVTGVRRRWLEHAAATVLDEVVPEVARTAPGELAATGMAVVAPILDQVRAREQVSDADLLRLAAWVSTVSVRDEVWGLMTRANAEEMLAALTVVSSRVVPPFEPAVLSLAAFAAWLTGDGAQALIAVERALEVEPCYSMAGLILEILERGISPESWEGLPAAS
ncbi:DUF4192 domain-containing protein [Aeromicrobium chenweiae]|uniref:Uncharacterized protein n=1 Tax=Aeromicrobium chenweiae TaxID=2079793 RepID=A0A2S0WLA2_9ACTN|nr:DUF4192 domain-containing protein [Aeromicrobium chenweiae]AWB92052.1 hypothetical protein C3E78_07490 [Aeromicrobium chenweiae]TGN32902.1 DUF4192 domain-containing protein [Aeromicrobium chenweiae]